MTSIRWAVDSACPPFLRGFKARVEGSPLGYRLAKGAFWSLAGSVISRGLGLLSGILVARMLGRHEFGQLGMIQSTVGMFSTFAGFGMGLTANKHVAEFRTADSARAGRLIVISSLVAWVTGGIMTLALLAFAPWLASHTLASPALGSLLRTGALMLLLGGVNGAQIGALSGLESFKTIARVSLVAGMLSFPATVLGAWWGGVGGAVWGQVMALGLNCALNHWALRREAARADIPLGFQGIGREWKVLWSFSVPAVLAASLTGPVSWATSALLANQPDGYSQLGIYSAVLRIKIVPEIVLGILMAPLLPVLAERYAARDTAGYNKAASAAFSLSLLATLPLGLLQLAAPSLTLLPYGATYAGHHAVVQWLMLDLTVIGLFNPMASILASMNRMWFGFIYNLLSGAVYGLLGVFLIPRYGAAGLAAAFAGSHLVMLGPTLLYMYRTERAFLCGLPLGRLGLLLSAAAGVCVLAYAVLPSPLALLCGGLAVGGILWAHVKLLVSPREISGSVLSATGPAA
ncbi:MAG TPA: oligosaccharide flippase family protein [Candidatus Acidoferrum sp.]|jgi:O-antigen/teichoic acid export membrane protein|nr:oligosaccharide flippase family protein [Candidatus Acidoferrum sp.]